MTSHFRNYNTHKSRMEFIQSTKKSENFRGPTDCEPQATDNGLVVEAGKGVGDGYRYVTVP